MQKIETEAKPVTVTQKNVESKNTHNDTGYGNNSNGITYEEGSANQNTKIQETEYN